MFAHHKHAARDKAMADALAGVVASLIALWVFYPIEVWKTNVQAAVPSSALNAGRRDDEDGRHMGMVLRARIKRFFAGIRTKTLHTTTSSFCYFYLYSWIVSVYQRRQKCKLIPAPTQLVLSAVAAMLNTCLTLPFDVISTRHQVADMDGHQILSRSSSFNSSDAYIFYDPSSSSQEEDDTDHRVLSLDHEGDEEKVTKNDRMDSQIIMGPISTFLKTGRPYRWRSLWKGILPSLLLCVNPAIHYTAYDVAKARFLQRRSSDKQRRLSMVEAFLLGLLAKFVATVATYPFIQAKTKLMTSSNHNNASLRACLLCEYEQHGVKGLYRGCNLQLIHTLLKSALMMVLRERTMRTTRQWLQASSRQDAYQ
jgi:hypothetical protein